MSQFKITLITPAGIIDNANAIGYDKIKTNKSIGKDSDLFYYTKEIVGKLTFIGKEFELLKAWETSDKRTKKGTIIIKDFQNGSYVELLRHVILIDNISWNLYKSAADYNMKEQDSFIKSYDAIKDKEVNVFDYIPTSNRFAWKITPTGTYGGTQQPITFVDVQNGVWLKDAITVLIQRAYPSAMVKSKLFGWNEPSTYNVGPNSNQWVIAKLMLAQMSDIYRRAGTANPATAAATTMSITPDNALKSLCVMFNLKCDYSHLTNVFRLEHISWFGTSGVSDTIFIGENKGIESNYEYATDGLVKTETVTYDNRFAKLFGLTDFLPLSIEYDAYDGNQQTKESTVSFVCEISLFTQYGEGVNQTTEEDGVDMLNGIFLGSLDTNNTLIRRLGVVNGTASPVPKINDAQMINGYMSWAYLSSQYHKHNKSYATGKMNGAQTTFGTKPRILQKNLRVIDTTLQKDYLKASITSGLGNGICLKTERELASKYIICDIYHNAITPLALGAPSAIADNYYTKTNITIDTYLQSLASLLANDTTGCSVLPESKPTQAGGTVNILANGHFVYVPPTGYDGFDTFDYYIINGSQLVDTATCTIGIRIPMVYIHKDTITNIVGSNANDQSKIRYFRTNGYDYPYNPKGLGLTVYMQGYNTLSVLVQTWNFSPASENETIPPPTGFTNPTTFTKTIVSNSEYTIF